MRFVVVRSLTQSELGWFFEVRRLGRETSKQRAINFDLPVIERLFPTATADDRIPLHIAFRDDDGDLVIEERVLKRFAKNWRLMGGGVAPKRFGDVQPGDLFVGVVVTDETPATLFLEVCASGTPTAKWILSRPEVSRLVQQGMVALSPSEVGGVGPRLADLDLELFGELQRSPAPPRNTAVQGPANAPKDDLRGGRDDECHREPRAQPQCRGGRPDRQLH